MHNKTELLSGLNEPQQEAVIHTEGPVLVLAGAGSGKTKALTHRIAYLIREKHVSQYNILAVTFTNKAAQEMSERVGHLLASHESRVTSHEFGNFTRLPWMGTFHSICVKILRRDGKFLGYESNFTIYDDNDQISIIKRIMKDLAINPKNYNPRTVQYFISGAKNELMTATDYKKYLNSPFEVVTSKVYDRYEEYLKSVNAMDFDDLIMRCVNLFQQYPEVLERYQNLFKYILIDEYQDTNQAQYVWAKLLALKNKNIMVVGDDFQSIYSWRGANFKNILNFEKDYKDAITIKLEQNYRSTKTILSAADQVIKYNKQRTDKTLWTDNPEGEQIMVFEALNEKDEGEYVAAEVRRLVNSQKSRVDSRGSHFEAGTNYNDFAVLYRTNAQSRAIEEAMLKFKIPYKVVGGIRFYERKEIKDMLAYLRYIANPRDLEAMQRCIQVPGRGIGEKTVEKIREYLTSFVIPAKAGIYGIVEKKELDPRIKSEDDTIEVNNDSTNGIKINNYKDDTAVSRPKLGGVMGGLSDNFSKKVTDFFEMMIEFRELSTKKSLPDFILFVADRTGMKDFLLDGTPEGEGRWENVEELATVASQIVIAESLKSQREDENGEKTIEYDEEELTPLDQLLQQVALVQDTDAIESDEKVTLMTMHAAKGLEFENVFIVGAEEGLFPHSRAVMDEGEMEEERRLCYVGITRAKERLYLVYASERNIYGRFQSNARSRFIDCIPEHLLDEF